MYQGRLCVPNFDYLRNGILEKTHGSHYSIHLGSTNNYNDLREVFFWEGLNRDITEFVAKFQNIQQVSSEHQKPGVYSKKSKFQLGSGMT